MGTKSFIAQVSTSWLSSMVIAHVFVGLSLCDMLTVWISLKAVVESRISFSLTKAASNAVSELLAVRPTDLTIKVMIEGYQATSPVGSFGTSHTDTTRKNLQDLLHKQTELVLGKVVYMLDVLIGALCLLQFSVVTDEWARAWQSSL